MKRLCIAIAVLAAAATASFAEGDNQHSERYADQYGTVVDSHPQAVSFDDETTGGVDFYRSGLTKEGGRDGHGGHR